MTILEAHIGIEEIQKAMQGVHTLLVLLRISGKESINENKKFAADNLPSGELAKLYFDVLIRQEFVPQAISFALDYDEVAKACKLPLSGIDLNPYL